MRSTKCFFLLQMSLPSGVHLFTLSLQNPWRAECFEDRHVACILEWCSALVAAYSHKNEMFLTPYWTVLPQLNLCNHRILKKNVAISNIYHIYDVPTPERVYLNGRRFFDKCDQPTVTSACRWVIISYLWVITTLSLLWQNWYNHRK